MKQGTKQGKHRGFSLIELLIVLAIIGMLGAVVAPQVMKHFSGSKSKTAKLQIENLGAALDMFYLENGRYPSTEEGLLVLIQRTDEFANWNGPYLKKKRIPKDPWGKAYHYKSPGENGEYDLFSYGADNALGGEQERQDIVSWE